MFLQLTKLYKASRLIIYILIFIILHIKIIDSKKGSKNTHGTTGNKTMLFCYACQHSNSDVYDPDSKDDWCSNENLLKLDDSDTIKPCAPWEPFCMTTITTMLDSFSSISRSCAERCMDYCESVSYGTDMVTCGDCCSDNKCNSNYTLTYYKQIMEKQYIGWKTPLSGEVQYNRQNNIKFPY
uniref:Toxin_TOLIP domain-containing protein n=1 Tax=Parastrongyloides trichosuri TaxID=131310 RepID=A0A0N5A5B1_PARTI